MIGQERLVAASQALELQHLQTLIRSREKEMNDAVSKSNNELERSRLYAKEVVDRNLLLESQIEQLTSQVRVLQNSAMDRNRGTVADLFKQTTSQSACAERQTQEDLRDARAACARLTEEREVLLEKLVHERDRVSDLERKLSQRSSRHNGSGGLSVGIQTDTTATAAVPPEDYRSIIREEEVLPGKEAIEFIRRRIDIEQLRVNESQDACSFHSANIAALHDRLQMRIQGELTKLQTEQDQYSRLMTNYQSVLNNSGTAPVIPTSGLTPPPRQQPVASTTPTPRRDYFPQAQQALFQKQENEMQSLRRRLQELQSRQDGTSVGVSNNSASLPSPIQHSSILQRMLLNATN